MDKYEVKSISFKDYNSNGKIVYYIIKNGTKLKTKDGAVIYYFSSKEAENHIENIKMNKLKEQWVVEKNGTKWSIRNSKKNTVYRTGSGLVKRFDTEKIAKTVAANLNKTDYPKMVPIAKEEYVIESGQPDYPDLRQDYDKKAILDGGALYLKNTTVQIWWRTDKSGKPFTPPIRGRETYVLPTKSAAKSAFAHTLNMYKRRGEPTLFDDKESDFLVKESSGSGLKTLDEVVDFIINNNSGVVSYISTEGKLTKFNNPSKSELKNIISTLDKHSSVRFISKVDSKRNYEIYRKTFDKFGVDRLPKGTIREESKNIPLDQYVSDLVDSLGYHAMAREIRAGTTTGLDILTYLNKTKAVQTNKKVQALVSTALKAVKDKKIPQKDLDRVKAIIGESKVRRLVDIDKALEFLGNNPKYSDKVSTKKLLLGGKVLKTKTKDGSYEISKYYGDDKLGKFEINRLPIKSWNEAKEYEPIKTKQEFLKRLKNPTSMSPDQNAYRIAVDQNQDTWVPANFGDEKVFKSRSGKRLQYVFNPKQHKHAYYDVDADMILDDDEALTHMNGPIDYEKSLTGTQARKITTSVGWSLLQKGQSVPVSYYGAIGKLHKKDSNWYVFTPGKI